MYGVHEKVCMLMAFKLFSLQKRVAAVESEPIIYLTENGKNSSSDLITT